MCLPFLLLAQQACAKQMVWYLKAGAKCLSVGRHAVHLCASRRLRICLCWYLWSAKIDVTYDHVTLMLHQQPWVCELLIWKGWLWWPYARHNLWDWCFGRSILLTQRIVHHCNFHHLCCSSVHVYWQLMKQVHTLGIAGTWLMKHVCESRSGIWSFSRYYQPLKAANDLYMVNTAVKQTLMDVVINSALSSISKCQNGDICSKQSQCSLACSIPWFLDQLHDWMFNMQAAVCMMLHRSVND